MSLPPRPGDGRCYWLRLVITDGASSLTWEPI
ncbi:MAG: hypothetical protein QOE70_4389 [Chthoniobacter sp.]|jgi:hypothetical protein|nr:hypothetical protein [Chthoniobacter sp.]